MKDLRQRGRTRPGFVDSIKSGRAVPIISNEALLDHVFGSHAIVTKGYAEHTGLTLDDPDDIPRVARFFKLVRQKEALLEGNDFTHNDLRADFCDFMKNLTYYHAEQHIGDGDHDVLEEAEAQYGDKTVSEFAELLGYPTFHRGAHDPLLVLASLPFRVFLTTSPHTFLEAALERANKTPTSTMIRWRQDLRDLHDRSVDDHEPDSQHPLVCHIFGMDNVSSSLVLTEDDHLDFLVDVNQHRDNDTLDSVPAQVRKALSTDVLVLGFSLNSWAFRSLYGGLLKAGYVHNERRGIFVQLPPSDTEQSYVHDYLQREAKFEVVWKDLEAYAQELRTLL